MSPTWIPQVKNRYYLTSKCLNYLILPSTHISLTTLIFNCCGTCWEARIYPILQKVLERSYLRSSFIDSKGADINHIIPELSKNASRRQRSKDGEDESACLDRIKVSAILLCRRFTLLGYVTVVEFNSRFALPG